MLLIIVAAIVTGLLVVAFLSIGFAFLCDRLAPGLGLAARSTVCAFVAGILFASLSLLNTSRLGADREMAETFLQVLATGMFLGVIAWLPTYLFARFLKSRRESSLELDKNE